jgi:hypothetical protein
MASGSLYFINLDLVSLQMGSSVVFEYPILSYSITWSKRSRASAQCTILASSEFEEE